MDSRGDREQPCCSPVPLSAPMGALDGAVGAGSEKPRITERLIKLQNSFVQEAVAAGLIHGRPCSLRGLLLLGLAGYPGGITLSITTHKGDVGIGLTHDRCFYGLITNLGD